MAPRNSSGVKTPCLAWYGCVCLCFFFCVPKQDDAGELTLLEPQSRFGHKPLNFQVVYPQKRDCGPKRVKVMITHKKKQNTRNRYRRRGDKHTHTLSVYSSAEVLLRGTIVNRTCGIHKNLYI